MFLFDVSVMILYKLYFFYTFCYSLQLKERKKPQRIDLLPAYKK